MTETPNFSIVSREGIRPVASKANTEKGISDFIKKTLSQLKHGEWLVMDIEEDYPWSILLGLESVSFSKEAESSELEELFILANATGLPDEGLAPFEFEYSRLALRVSDSSYLPSLSVLSRYRGSLFLACGREGVHENGVVVLGELASYSYFYDYTGAPVSWSGGAILCRVSPKTAFSIGTGDSEEEPEAFNWRSNADMSDSEADSVAYWLAENRLAFAFAWNRVEPNLKYFSEQEMQLVRRIIEDTPLRLSLNFDAHEQLFIEEYLPRYSDLYLTLRDSLIGKHDPLMWELFLYHGLSGLLANGGTALEEAFLVYSEARRAITKFYLPSDPAYQIMPDFDQTITLVRKLERLEPLEQSEIERILLENEDRFLRKAPVILKKALGKDTTPTDYLQVLLSAFRTWLQWQELKKYLPMLIEETLRQ
jgi:hypothetical protein